MLALIFGAITLTDVQASTMQASALGVNAAPAAPTPAPAKKNATLNASIVELQKEA